jgi:hypothetical protein
MTEDLRSLAPSTPDATAAVAQSRTGETPAAQAVEPPEECPGLGTTFTIGPGVERPARTHAHERRSGDPIYRPLRIYTLDPAASRLDGAVATVNVPYEPLEPGPRGALLEVDPNDGARNVRYRAVDLEDPKVLITNGRTPSPSDHLFHQQMVYAVASTVCSAFQTALGRHISWGFDRVARAGPQEHAAAVGLAGPAVADERSRLLLRPHAACERNAYYDKARGEVCFGYFRAGERVTGRNPPFGYVFTCLSHDIIAHELSHALLDGLRQQFTVPSGPDVLAFHEAFADLVAVFQHFSYEQVVRAAIAKSRGSLRDAELLSGLAQQFGDTTGLLRALRLAVDELAPSGAPRRTYANAGAEPHELGAVLLAAMFDAFTTVYERKTAPYVRLATNGTGHLPPGELPAELQTIMGKEASRLANQILTMCIRAIDYCPPVDLTLGEYLRALITADYDLVPDDPWGYREALIDAFWKRELYPQHVSSLSEDALLWRPPGMRIPPVSRLAFAELRFAGDPARPAGAAELRRQACALGALVSQPELTATFGLAPPDHHALGGDTVDPPTVESVRSTRRVGPDGQVVFDLVAEITQRRAVRASGSTPGFDFYGGSTVLLGPDGTIRYIISKNVLSADRLERQRRFVAGAGSAYWHMGPRHTLVPRRQLFRMLHAHGSGG